MMSVAEMRGIGQTLFGPEWQAPMARAIDVNPRTIRRILAEGTVSQDIGERVRRLITHVPVSAQVPLTVHVERGADRRPTPAECAAAFGPALEALARSADAAGWPEAQVLDFLEAWIAERRAALALRQAEVEAQRAATAALTDEELISRAQDALSQQGRG